MTAWPIKALPSPPLRFLALVIGGWICVRAAILFPPAGTDAVPDAPPPAVGPAFHVPLPRLPAETASARVAARYPVAGATRRMSLGLARADVLALSTAPALVPPPALLPSPPGLIAHRILDRAEALPLPPPASAAGRWSGSAWLLARRDSGGAALAPGGTLGGSQAGARILYRVGGGLALSGRAYAPLHRPQGAELAAGLDWRPAKAIPLNILAERRQALGREGRSAFSIIFYGGASRALAGGLRLDAYAQAGIVGLKARDAFFDGAVRLSAPIGPVEIGGGAWGAAQPGAARLDAGPSLSYRLPVAGAHLRLQADWRLRVAGDAAPGSGPALTLAADF